MLDWIAREGSIVISWWLLVTLAGAAALPLCLRLLGGLPDRGYTLARAAGLLLVGFTFWLLASLGFLRNTPGNMVFAWLVVLGVSLVVYLRLGPRLDLRAWWSENRAVVIVGEVVFLALLLAWALVRAHENRLTGTEKPMELMFMGAVMRSDTFPPNDAWMAGYAISYYYFGYILSAMLSMLSGISSIVGFNMTISLLFALAGLGAFGVVYNLVRSRAFSRAGVLLQAGPTRQTAVLVGLLGTLFVVLLGNYQLPLVEIPYQTSAAPESYLRFWGVDRRETPLTFPTEDAQPLDPATWGGNGYWWWWRASRVVNDLDLNNAHMEVIDEFPQFSFLLADNHPHVLALPFVLLALGMALNVLLASRAPTTAETLFYGLAVGGLAFLNTWDGPVYLLAIAGADGLRRLMRHGKLSRYDWVAVAGFAAVLLGLAFILYLPFWLGFRSQAGGILPNLLNPTRTPQLFLMFGPFFLLLPPFLLVEIWRGRGRMNWRLGLLVVLGVLALFLAALLLFTGLGLAVPALRGDALRAIESAGGFESVVGTLLSRRAEAFLTTAVLLLGLLVVVARLFGKPSAAARRKQSVPAGAEDVAAAYPPAHGFALGILALALILVLAPEFVYLRDNFGSRMNTVFKFYYQAWVLFSAVAAYGLFTVFADRRLPVPGSGLRGAYGAFAALAITLGLLYPVLGIYTRTQVESGRLSALNPSPLTLDGGSSFVNADDYAAIMCFDALVEGDEVLAVEATGPAYQSEYGRVAALTGVPILLGWENHERQWRGATYDAIEGTRAEDIARLYQDPRWEVALGIINQYGIDYIFYGSSERNAYGVGGEDKFRDNLEPVCERGGSLFYRVPQTVVAAR